MSQRNLFYSLFVIVFFGCYKKETNYLQDNKYNILSVTASSNSLPADGKSTLLITAVLSSDADLTTVNFLTTKGNFLDSSRSYTTTASISNNSLIAQAYLVASLDTSSYVFVTVSVPGLDSILNIKFVTALPDSIHIESTLNQITTGYGDSVPLQTWLYRNPGVPSLNQSVQFSALDATRSSIGYFTGVSRTGSDSNGLIHSQFVLSDSGYIGPVKIFATFSGTSRPLSDSFVVHVTN